MSSIQQRLEEQTGAKQQEAIQGLPWVQRLIQDQDGSVQKVNRGGEFGFE